MISQQQDPQGQQSHSYDRHVPRGQKTLELFIQGVGLTLYFFRYFLKPTIVAQNWHDWVHLEENIHPFVFLK